MGPCFVNMLYVHIPFCHHKCTYCGFYSVAGHRYRDAYVDALCSEIAMRADGHRLTTVYFGGGTPTQLTVKQLGTIVDAVCKGYDTTAIEEATIETNPEDLTKEYIEELSSLHFFNRISIGVQSFSDSDLHAINRVHTSQQAIDAVSSAAAAGFDNISIDLILGLPGQSVDGWRQNLKVLTSLAADYPVRHISCYELTVESGTILERQLKTGRVCLPEDEYVAIQYDDLGSWCACHGFEQYEVSNYSLPGFRSRHNSRYWNRTPYIGVGAAAHSFDGKSRRWNQSDIERYITGANRGEVPFGEEHLSGIDAFNEYVMTALRTVDGIDKSMIQSEYRDYLSKSIVPFLRRGLVVETENAYRPTAEGLILADGIAAELFK